MKFKTRLIIGATALLGLMLPQLFLRAADQASDDRERVVREREGAGAGALFRIDHPSRADKLIGRRVNDYQGRRMGKVKDLALDLQNGRVLEVIVADGGVPGFNQKLVAVPPESFTWEDSERSLGLDVSREQLQSAPRFKMSDWRMETHDGQLQETYRRFGVRPYFFNGELDGLNPNSNYQPIWEVASAAKLMGRSTRNDRHEKMGKVENLMVDLPTGRVLEIVVVVDGDFGVAREFRAVPPQKFHLNLAGDVLTMDVERSVFLNAPQFKADEWQDAAEADRLAEVYGAFGLTPAVSGTEENVRYRNAAPAEIRPTDHEITDRVRRELAANHDLSEKARDVQVTTENGRVILHGAVNTDGEKSMIGDTARKILKSNNVDNELEVQATPVSIKPDYQ